jgi:sulfotransferase family protein
MISGSSGETMAGSPGDVTAPASAAEETPFDFRAMLRQVEALLEKQIFFVGGAEKSGTSWLQGLLDLHPEVTCAGEYHFVESLFPALKTALETRNTFSLPDSRNPLRHELGEPIPLHDFNDLQFVTASAIAMLLLKPTGKSPKAIGERSARNVHDFDSLTALFPGAKCIQIVRDPRDGAVSQWFHIRRLAPPNEWSRLQSKSSVARMYAGMWAEVVGRGMRFGERNPGRYFELRYEDLLDRTAPILGEIFRFLGVDDSIETARRCAESAAFEKLTGGRPRGQEDPRSFFRKAVVGDWKNHLDAETNAFFIAKAGPLMRRFGYL